MEPTTEEERTAQETACYDVIVSGGGPVGLFLACELALAKCSVLILEKAENSDSPLKRIPFGIRGLSTPSVEALYRRGLLDELQVPLRLKNPHQTAAGSRRQAGHFAGIPFYYDDIDTSQWGYRLPGSSEPSIISEMAELESVFARRAASLGVVVMRGEEVTGLIQNADCVSVCAGHSTFKAKWLVGCDGSRSAVRKAGGFKFEGTEPEFTGYSTLVDIAEPGALKLGRNITPTGMYMQSKPGYVIIQDFDRGAFHMSGSPITREHVQDVLRRVSGTEVTVSALHIATTWTDRARQVTAYRNGRVFMAGDAAHIHSPLGGQGLNLGLGDAMNLGWKLAAAVHGRAPEGLLDSYGAERQPIGSLVMDWSRAQVAIMRPQPEARALHAIFRDLMGTRDGATYFAGRVWGIISRYDLDSDHPIVGRSVPEFEFEHGEKLGHLMQGGRALLLDFERSSKLSALSTELGCHVTYLSHRPKECLGLGALLVRPDGIIAWAKNEGAENAIGLREAVKRWFA